MFCAYHFPRNFNPTVRRFPDPALARRQSPRKNLRGCADRGQSADIFGVGKWQATMACHDDLAFSESDLRDRFGFSHNFSASPEC
jgi:hypothetical protein